jgi:diketogulonate reductase-like aldo/keto reductase
MNLTGPANTLLRTVGKTAFIYGTAWKKEATAALVQDALAAGFTAIDTAAQPKHYREDLVGEGLRASFRAGVVKREDVFVSSTATKMSQPCL